MKLGSAENANTVKSHIDLIQNKKDGNNLSIALQVARDELFSEKNGARRDVPKTLLVFVDRKSKNSPSELASVGQSLRDAGVKIVVVGIGLGVDEAELMALAGKEALFFPSSLEEMERQVVPVVESMLPGMRKRLCCRVFYRCTVETNFICCSRRGSQKPDIDFLVSACKFANNIVALANCPRVIVCFPLKMSFRYKNYFVRVIL